MGAGLLFALVLCAQHPAAPRAATDAAGKAQAQQLLREGTRLYRKGEYQEALERFTAAYTLYPSPKLQFNVGQTNRELGRPVEARSAFDRFLADPAGAPRSTIDEARRSLTELETQLGKIQVRYEAAVVDVFLDGVPQGRTPLAGPLWSTPGSHVLSLRGHGFAPFVETLEVRAGATSTVTPTLRALRLAPDLALLGRTRSQVKLDPSPYVDMQPGLWSRLSGRWWFWAAVGALAVGGGIAATLALTGGQGAPPTTLGAQKVFR
jgi:tetratricopeptide (TPR) repeat protein